MSGVTSDSQSARVKLRSKKGIVSSFLVLIWSVVAGCAPPTLDSGESGSFTTSHLPNGVLEDGLTITARQSCYAEELVPDPLLIGGLVAIEPLPNSAWSATGVSIVAQDEYGNELGSGLSTLQHIGETSATMDALFTYTFPGGIFEIPIGTVKVNVTLCGDGDYSFRSISPEAFLAKPGVWPSLYSGLRINRPADEACYSGPLKVDQGSWGATIAMRSESKKQRAGWVRLELIDQNGNVLLTAIDTETSFASDPVYFEYAGGEFVIPFGTTTARLEICGSSFAYIFTEN